MKRIINNIVFHLLIKTFYFKFFNQYPYNTDYFFFFWKNVEFCILTSVLGFDELK